MNILFVNPLYRIPYLVPLRIGYIASILRNEGHKVNVLNLNTYLYSKG